MPHMKEQVPLPGIYDPDFIAANQDTRADNIIKGTRSEQVEQVRQQIRTFKEEQKVDKVNYRHCLLKPCHSCQPKLCTKQESHSRKDS